MDPSVIEEFENKFAFEDIDTDVLITDPDVPLLKTLDAVDSVNCFVRESTSRFDSTVCIEDDILEDCVKLETDASSDEETTEEVTASDTVDDVPSVLLSDKVTDEIVEDEERDEIVEDEERDEIEEDGVRDDSSDDNETDEEIADDC